MIAPKIVSHVQPTGRDYSATTAADIIDGIPEAVPCDNCGRDHIPDATDPTQDATCWECQNGYGDEAGYTTVGAALLFLVCMFLAGLFTALTLLGMPAAFDPVPAGVESPEIVRWTYGNYR